MDIDIGDSWWFMVIHGDSWWFMVINVQSLGGDKFSGPVLREAGYSPGRTGRSAEVVTFWWPGEKQGLGSSDMVTSCRSIRFVQFHKQRSMIYIIYIYIYIIYIYMISTGPYQIPSDNWSLLIHVDPVFGMFLMQSDWCSYIYIYTYREIQTWSGWNAHDRLLCGQRFGGIHWGTSATV